MSTIQARVVMPQGSDFVGTRADHGIHALTAALSWRARAMGERTREAIAALGISFRSALRVTDSEATLIGDCQAYWNELSDEAHKRNSHWCSAGEFALDSRWHFLGKQHVEIWREFASAVNVADRPKRVVEWGCGGGMNAIHFSQICEKFYGIDISPESLNECCRQVRAVGQNNFSPVLIDAANPEAVKTQLAEPCDLFLSTYVFELLPTPEYGIRVVQIAHHLLAPGGLAMLQIKYRGKSASTRSRSWAYAKNLAWNTTYRIEEFWEAAAECGFTPKMLKLVPQQPLVHDRNYAYFLLQK